MTSITYGEKNRRYKWLLIGILFLISCLFLVNILLDKLLPQKIKEQLASLDPRIKIDVISVKASILRSAIHLDGITIQLMPDTNHSSPHHSFHFAGIDLSGISFFSLLFRNKMLARKLNIKNGEIQLNKELLSGNKLNEFNFLSDIGLPFEELSIDQINIEKSKIEICRKNDIELDLFARLKADGITLKKKMGGSPHRFSSFLCELSEIRYSIPESAETISIKKVSFGSPQNDCMVDSLRIIPQFGKYEFAKKIGHQTDRIEAFISTIHILHPNWSTLPEKKIMADKIIIGPAHVTIFRDRRIPCATWSPRT